MNCVNRLENMKKKKKKNWIPWHVLFGVVFCVVIIRNVGSPLNPLSFPILSRKSICERERKSDRGYESHERNYVI
jgi:hypothetical protein